MKSDRKPHHGQVMILFALTSIIVLAGAALAVDVGFILAERRQAQAAADAAALAADMVYQRAPINGTVPTDAIVQSGKAYAEYNGYAADDAVIEPLATYTIPGGDTLERCVRATITSEVEKFFLQAVYAGSWEVSASAVACTSPEPREYAIVALNPGGTGITAVGTSNMTIHNGGAMSNATIDFTGTSSWIQPDGALDAYNGITNSNNTTVEADSLNGAAPQVPDPFASVNPPTAAQCGVSQPNPNIVSGSPSVTILEPGTYSSGITATGGGGGSKSIVLRSGVYCFDANFTVQSGQSNPRIVYGEGVLLYFRGSARLDISGGGAGFNVSYTTLPASVSVPPDVAAALTGGSCVADACAAEIVIYYNRASCSNLRLEGGNSLNVTGIIYAPCSPLGLAGHSGSEITGQIITGSADFAGTSDLTITYSSSSDTMVPLVFLVR